MQKYVTDFLDVENKTIEEFISDLVDAKNHALEAGAEEKTIRLNVEAEDMQADFFVSYWRKATDTEIENAKKMEERKKEFRKNEYLRLKKEFDPS